MNEFEYNNKWKCLKDEFSPEFMEKMKTSPLVNRIGNMLTRDVSTFNIIEDLVNMNEKLQAELTERIAKGPSVVYVKPINENKT